MITAENIELAIDTIEGLSDEQYQTYAETFANAQPNLVSYLFVQQDEFSENDFDLLTSLTLTIYKAFEMQCGTPRVLTVDEIEQKAIEQMDDLDALEEADESQMEAYMAKIIENQAQPILMDFAAHELHVMESEGAIEHESGGALLYPVLQLMVTMLDAAFHGSAMKIV
jgi:hypothetical protein